MYIYFEADFHERQTEDVLQWGWLTVVFTCKNNHQYFGLGKKLENKRAPGDHDSPC